MGVTPLTGLPAGAAAAAIAQRLSGPTWVVAPDEATAELLHGELCFYLGSGRAWLYPVDDSKPYEGLSPHPALPMSRVAALDALGRGGDLVVVAPAAALLPRVLPPDVLAASPTIRKGEEHDPRSLAAALADLGYLAVGRVEDPGTFRLRGEVLDVWPAGAEQPARVEFFDTEVEALRALDPERQRSAGALEALRILPAREEVFGAAPLARARSVLRERVDALGYGARLRREVIEDFKAGIRFSGCGDYLPALHPLVLPFAHSPGAEVVVVDRGAVDAAIAKALSQAEGRYKALSDADRPLIPPEMRYAAAPELAPALDRALPIHPVAVVIDGEQAPVDLGARDNDRLRSTSGELAHAAGIISDWLAEGWRVGLVVDATSRAERLRQLLHPHGLRPRELRQRDPARWPPGVLVQVRGDLPRGFHNPDAQLAVITADELLGSKLRVRTPHGRAHARLAQHAAVTSFAQLKEGDLVVHARHGIGRFHGLRRVDLGHGPEDMVQLEYRGGDRMYLPVHRLDQLYRYRAVGGAREPRLDKLGGETWSLRKSKVKDAVLKLAHELIELAARRAVNPGQAYPGRSNRFRRFEESFPYTETPDQAAAIEAVLDDLAQEKPTDRLIVGDTGFGKTEVAMRAAFRVVEAGRQVAVLCPTTVLAAQHARTFAARFEPFGATVALISRFGTPAEDRALGRRIREGAVDVVVGTTRLLGRGVRFKDLGLVVIDEEHRFGVRQKAKIRRLRAEVDTLAMSATPIPRSLHMAMSGIREISVIATPPQDRLPVRTAVARNTPERVREDLLRELRRGGQAFFVHNRVASIDAVARAVAQAVPEAKLAVAHGQMEGGALEQVLVDFVERRSDVLVCTSIIEAGLDMPNVNTILINRAERFGLAQLHQLRGRVGRSHRRGYCTLLVADGEELTPKAMQRLRVLQEHTQLGSGFQIAAADLELRGAGNLLGEKQHGHIQAVGFETWTTLLEEAMAEARGEAERQSVDPEVELGLPAFIPDDYVVDVDERLVLYRRLAGARTPAEVRDELDAIEDTNGELPVELVQLGRTLEIKCRCRALGVSRCAMLKVRAVLDLIEQTAVPDAKIEALVAAQPRRFKWSDRRLEVRFTPEEGQQPFLFLHWVLGLLEKAVQ
ncbi:MAG: transcription-repair coupling factor [Alphaproteobacteria bacterium]|nr:transcription-repair coupling factor [Alphaproteobacteria bacterium]